MNEIVSVNYDSDRPTVSARELHRLLEIRTAFKDWFPRMCEYGFDEGKDFCSILSESTGGRPSTDYQITLDMAKEICMIQRTETGKRIRQQYIDLERKWNSPEMIMSRALQLSQRQLQAVTQENSLLLQENAEMKPKAEFYDEVIEHGKSLNFRDTAKIIGCGQNQLINALISHKYIYRDSSGEKRAYFVSIKAGLFIQRMWQNDKTSGVQVLITPKGVDMCRKLMKNEIKKALPSSEEPQTRATKR